MIFVGIDVAKDKHDCFILNSEGTVLADVFTIANNRIGFETLLSRIQSCSQGESKIKVGLEATGHYSYNLLGFLLDSGLATYVINPLHTNLYRKSLSLRRTKTDRIDARTIAMMLMSDVDLKSYSNTQISASGYFSCISSLHINALLIVLLMPDERQVNNTSFPAAKAFSNSSSISLRWYRKMQVPLSSVTRRNSAKM